MMTKYDGGFCSWAERFKHSVGCSRRFLLKLMYRLRGLHLNVIFKCPIITSFMSSINLSGLLSEKSTLYTVDKMYNNTVGVGEWRCIG